MAAAEEKILLRIGKEEEVSAIWNRAENPVAAISLAHGAGAPMTHPFMASLARHLSENGISVLRFNFLYMERKSRRPDVPGVAHKVISQALNQIAEEYPWIPVIAAGKSFGGRMSTQYLSQSCPDFVKGVVLFGFPLHPPGKASIERAEHLYALSIPMLFHQGTRDTLATMDLMKEVVKKLPTATLVPYEGADHSFKSGKKLFIPELADQTVKWINTIV